MDSPQPEYPLEPRTVFLVIMSVVWLVDPLVAAALERGLGDGLVIFGAPLAASLVSAPILAGMYCASTRPSVFQCALAVLGSSVPLVWSMAGTILLADPMAVRPQELIELAAVTGSVSILLALFTWGMAGLFWTYGLRRAKMSIRGMVVGTVATALALCLSQWLMGMLGLGQFSIALVFDVLLPYAIMMFIVGVFLVTLYWRRIETDMLGIGLIILPTFVVIAALSGGAGMTELTLFICFFVLALYGILRLGIEMEVVPWRPLPAAPSSPTPVDGDGGQTGEGGRTDEGDRAS